jgi:adenylate kinase family enzyme
MRILIMGLPGAGKSTLAKRLNNELASSHLINGTDLRKQYDAWDFSSAGRNRQAYRMYQFSLSSGHRHFIADFTAATEDERLVYAPDFIVWLNTVKSCEHTETNELFKNPKKYDLRFDSHEEIDFEKTKRLISYR